MLDEMGAESADVLLMYLRGCLSRTGADGFVSVPRSYIDRAIELLAALPSGAEPVAPREPTADMLRAGMDDLGWWVEPYEAPRESGVPTENDMSAEDAAAINSQQIEAVASCYRAMVAAAPATPQSSSQVTEDTARLVEQAFRDGMIYGTNVAVTDPDEAWRTSRARRALRTDKQP